VTRFDLLPVAVQNLVCFWALLACLISLADSIFLLRQRRRARAALTALCFFLAYFALHVCREGSELRLHGHVTPLAGQLLSWPCLSYLAMLLSVSAICAALFWDVRRWRGSHITSASIKESIDGLPAGVCYYLEEGRCILVNHRMNAVCLSLLGQPLQNGAELYDFVKGRDVHALSDGTAVSFRHRLLTYDGAPLHELIADDITELFEKNEQLRSENERARQLAAGMKAYGETISDTVRRQEILQAKVNIHDEMNRMILSTDRAARGDASPAERREILNMWRSQALLLCREADSRRSSSVVSDLNALAAVLGLRVRWDGVPDSEDQAVLALFLSAAREAMANAAKHARAEELCIRVEEREGALRAVFTNDGLAPAQSVEETGGLRNLRSRLEKANGQMEIDTERGFRLTVTIPKGGTDRAISGFDR